MRQQRIHQGMLLMSRARVHDDSGRLVEHEEIVVLENDVELYLLRLRVDFLDFRFPQFHGVTGADEFARAGRLPIEKHESVADQGLKPGPGKSGEGLGEKTVEPLPRLFAGDGELDYG